MSEEEKSREKLQKVITELMHEHNYRAKDIRVTANFFILLAEKSRPIFSVSDDEERE